MSLYDLPARVVKAQTGLSANKICKLLSFFSEAMHRRKVLKDPYKTTKTGDKRNYDDRQLLILTLSHLKTNITNDALSSFFKVPRGSMSYLLKTGKEVLKDALNEMGAMPYKDIYSNVQAAIVLKNGAIIDATERSINRPAKNQQDYYSGKKKGILLKIK